MTKQTEAMKLALEALENLIKKTSGQAIYSFMETERRIAMAACVGLREALAEQPAQQEPLTDEQREEIANGWRGRNWTVGDIIDAVEAAHGIKGDA